MTSHEELLDGSQGFFEAEFEHSSYIYNNEADWDSSNNEPQTLEVSVPAETGVLTPKKETSSPEGVSQAIPPHSNSPTHGLSEAARSSPRHDKVEYVIPTPEQNDTRTVDFNTFSSADILPSSSRASYSELDADSSPGLFSTGLENLSDPTGPGCTELNTVNLDYFQFSVDRSGHSRELYLTPNARARAATMATIQSYSNIPNKTPNAVAYTDPRPSFGSRATRRYNDRGNVNHAPADVEIPTFEELMDPISSGVDINTQFSSVDEANSSCRKTFNIPPDPTIPWTIEQKRAIVRALCKAMKSVDRAEDNPGMIRPFVERKYSDTRIEVACWNILETCIERHTTGPLLAAYELKARQSSDIPTFGQRIQRILDCLITQKTICKHLLDPLYLFTFVDDPVGSQRRVIANKTLNKRKGEVMNAGKQALGHTRGNSTASGSVSGRIDSDDPFVSNSPFSTPRGVRAGTGILKAEGEVTTPDSVNRRAMGAMTISSPAVSSPVSDERFQQGLISGTSSFNATPNLRHINRAYGSSPAMGNPQGAGQDRTGFPRSNSAQGLGRTMQELSPADKANLAQQYHAIYMAGNEASFRRPLPRMMPGRRMTAPTSQTHLSEPSTPAPVTPPNRIKPSSSDSTSGHRRKRSSSDSDDSEYLPPSVKRTQR